MADKLEIAKPGPGEYPDYAAKYVSLIPEGDILARLEQQRRELLLLLSGRDEKDGNFRYAADKWSVKQLLGHISDTERIFAYRALRIARGDQTPLAGFEQDDYVREAGSDLCSLSALIEDFIAVRRASVSLFRNLPPAAWLRRGTTNQKEVTVRGLAYLVAGHEQHHTNILRERYFSNSVLSSQ